MKSYSLLVIAILFLFASVGHTQPQNNSAVDQGSPIVSPAPASEVRTMFFIVAELTDSINARKLKVGDKVKAEVTQDVIAKGRILIPVESRLIGHVTEAQARTDRDHPSRLGIVFDKIVFKHHSEVVFTGILRRLAAPVVHRSRVDEPDQMLPPSMLGAGHVGSAGTIGTGSSRTLSGNGASGSSMPSSAPVFVDGTPGSNVGNWSGGDLKRPSSGRTNSPDEGNTSLSVGMPQGITGLKGLDLSPGPTGPVIVSSVHDVKLDSGTQMLLVATDPHLAKP
jgi:hypothetical protein